MASLSEARERLCCAIASLSTDATIEDVCQTLDPILETFERENGAAIEFHADGCIATPLMVACDKAQEACIEWISNKNEHISRMDLLLGSPLDQAESGNAPMHYASSAGCLPAINLLSGMLDDKMETKRLNHLASQRNDNYDTPIMLAATRGHVAFLRKMYALLRQDEQEATSLFELANADGHTALSLACGHGHVEVVSFLVGEVGVSVTYDMIKQGEKTLKRIDEALKRVTMTKEHRARRNDVNRCLVILKVSLAKSAQASMEQLLADEDNERERKAKAEKSRNTKTTKRKAKRRDIPADRDAPLGPAMIAKAPENNKSDSKSGTDTLNGANRSHITVNSAQQNAKQSTRQDHDDESEDHVGPQTETDDNSLLAGPRSNSIEVDLDVDAIIEALCLDASMLLLSPKDMATNLSPCQLDAIAAVLRNQIQAVNEARIIQARLLDQVDLS